MRILHVITGLDVGGAETALLRLLAHEDRTRFRSEVFSLIGDGPIGAQMRDAGVPTLNCEAPRSDATRSLLALLGHCRRSRPDVIQGWMYHGNLAATLAARLTRVPRHGWNVRHSLHNISREKRSTALFIRGGAALSSLPSWVIYNSQRSAEQHARLGYSARHSVFIPNGFDCDMLRPDAAARSRLRAEIGLSESELVVGMIARYHPQKDYLSFVRAAASVARAAAGARFVAIGRGVTWANSELLAEIDRLGLRARFHLLGELPQAGLWSRVLDVNVLASAFGEGFPNVVAEGMACGVPTVATDVGDTAWIVGDAGRVVPPSDTAALAAAITALISATTDARRALGTRARARIVECFSIQRCVKEYAGLYAEGVRSTQRTTRETPPSTDKVRRSR